MAIETSSGVGAFTRQRVRPSLGGKRETAQYISEMALELRNLAKAHNLQSLQGLLEVAYYEAFSASTQIEPPPGELEHLATLSRASRS